MRRIRVTQTTVHEYVPDFNSLYYTENGIVSFESALEVDRRDVEGKVIFIDDLCMIEHTPETTSYQWEIVDD